MFCLSFTHLLSLMKKRENYKMKSHYIYEGITERKQSQAQNDTNGEQTDIKQNRTEDD